MDKQTSTVITGVGIISPLGIGKDAFGRNYVAGTEAIIAQKSVRFFERDYSYAIHDVPTTYEQCIPVAHRRRMSVLSRMTFAAAWMCLQDSQLDYPQYRDSMGIVLGTGWGELDSLPTLLMQATETADITVSPALFHTSVHNAPAGYLGIILEAKGPTLTVTQGDHSFETALATGNLLLQSGQCPAVLIGGADTFFDFAVLEREIDNHAQSVISRGSAFLLLEAEASARARNAPLLARPTVLPSRTLQSDADIADYALELKHNLDEQSSTPDAPIDLVLFTGSIAPSLGHRETDLLQAILQGNSAYLIHARGCSRPTQNAEAFIGALAILQQQQVPTGNLMRFHHDVCEPVATFSGNIDKVLLISVSERGSYCPFLLEKIQ